MLLTFPECAVLPRSALRGAQGQPAGCPLGGGRPGAQGPRGPGAEGQRLAARGQGSSAGVWQVGVNRAGVVWRRKDRALRDWNMEQNVTEGTQGKNVVAERKEVMGDRWGSKLCGTWGLFDGWVFTRQSFTRPSLGGGSCAVRGAVGCRDGKTVFLPPRGHAGRSQRCWRSSYPAGCSGRTVLVCLENREDFREELSCPWAENCRWASRLEQRRRHCLNWRSGRCLAQSGERRQSTAQDQTLRPESSATWSGFYAVDTRE